ncbi:MAG: hypothetical protein KBI47_08730 [Armatimonadetes bacterium]|jgi:hypothetical protein|nr:hypothetical protein [Armatimonadota bacterium]MDI9585637.1 hypothetical protein [Acidobacteriota bacterium]
MQHTGHRNPFEPVSPARLAPVYHWHPFALAFLAGEVDALQVIGLPGMGKTTLLSQVRHRLALDGLEAPYTCIPTGGIAQACAVPVGPVTLMDETDRLARADLAEILARVANIGGRVLLGTHRLHTAALRRAGFAPRTIRLNPLRDPIAAAELLLSRFATLDHSAGDAWTLAPGADRALLACSRGIPERILQIGYELFEDHGAPCIITPALVRAATRQSARAVRPTAASR